MSYKYRSLLYFSCFIICALVYNNIENNTDSMVALESGDVKEMPVNESLSASNNFEDDEINTEFP